MIDKNFECPFCGESVFCNNGEGCDTCRHYEKWLEAEEKGVLE